MTRMMAVNLTRSYPQLVANILSGWSPQELGDELRRITLGDWARVSLADRSDTTHVIGVFEGTIVSVYRVDDAQRIRQEDGEDRTRWSGRPADELGGWVGQLLPEGPWARGQARPLRRTHLEPSPIASAEDAMRDHLHSRHRYRLPNGFEPATSPSERERRDGVRVGGRGWIRLRSGDHPWPAWQEVDDYTEQQRGSESSDFRQSWKNIDTGAELVLFADGNFRNPSNARFRLIHRASPGSPHVELTEAVLADARNHGHYEADRVGHETYSEVLASVESVLQRLLGLHP